MGPIPATELNEDQRTAVEAGRGPFLIVAGAGTGKTSVIVERICRLVRDGTTPSRILALTFTEKAAAEMLDRVNVALGSFQLEIPIMTFNAYGESLLRRYATDIGLSRNFRTMGENAKIVFLRERLDELGLDYYAPVGQPDGLLGAVADYFSLLKQRVVMPAHYLSFAKKMPQADEAEKLDRKKHLELATAYDAYLRLSRESNVVDYDDQIYLMIELLGRRPNVLNELKAAYDYVMIDEFQDTNAMQSQLVDLIAGKHKNLFVVGDDDQSIYGWRGATLANILDFQQRYPDAQDVTLRQNYRSGTAILDKAYDLIQHNNPHRLEVRLSIDKRLVSDRIGKQPMLQGFATLDEELGWIANDIAQRISSGTPPGSIAVLARRNQTIELLHSHLDFAGITHVLAGQRHDLYQDPTVRMVLETLKTIVDPTDNTSLYHTLTGPFFSIPAELLASLSAQSRREHISLVDLLQKTDTVEFEPSRNALRAIFEWREKISTASVGQLAYEVLESSGYKDYLYSLAATDTQAASAVMRLSELFTTMKEFEYIALVPSVLQYIDALPALQAAGESTDDATLDLSAQAVNVLTIHKSKGLEWPIVYIADCTEGSFPLRQNSRGIMLPEGLTTSQETEADDHMAEERRLMYVAMTRAKDELLLSYAQRHTSSAIRRPSRFLSEAFGQEHSGELVSSEGLSVPVITGFTPVIRDQIPLPKGMLLNGHVTLSASQIENYLKCPLNFYYRYVLNVPTEPSPAADYGSLLHGLLEQMNRGLQSKDFPTLQTVIDLLEAQWPKGGHFSAAQRERSLLHARETVRRVHAAMSSSDRIPVAVEEPFSFSLKDADLTVRGRYDVVLPLGDNVEIVDYKTSPRADTADKAKARASASLQLTLYALAWQQLHDQLPALVTLDFISTGERGSLKKTQRGIDTLLGKLQDVADGIRAGNFLPGKEHDYCIHP